MPLLKDVPTGTVFSVRGEPATVMRKSSPTFAIPGDSRTHLNARILQHPNVFFRDKPAFIHEDTKIVLKAIW